MKSAQIPASDLVLNADGSVYHLHLHDENIADIVLLVGDPGRVAQVSSHFNAIEFQTQNREFITHTGVYNGTRITVISTGIGTDNVDIVMNELFAATHINLQTRTLKETKRALQIIRIGTSGALQPHIKLGDFVASAFGLGLDGLMYYYNYPFNPIETDLGNAFKTQIEWPEKLATPYFVEASKTLLAKIGFDMLHGITATGTGFYGPQGRNLRLRDGLATQELFAKFNFNGLQITNFEMETSAVYGLGNLFGFDCCTVDVIIANRATTAYLKDHSAAVDELIITILNRVTG